MTKRTVLNEVYKGLVESLAIPAELHERDGRKFASFGSVLPIHCATEDQVIERARTTHHYCDVFTDDLLAPLGELAYVRLDENTAEKVFINRSKRILLISSDGQLAQWRCAPSFESANQYVAGAPIVNQDGALVSVVTAKRGNHYAVSSFEGEGGYFDTSLSWKTLQSAGIIYGAETFGTRAALRAHVALLPPAHALPPAPPAPVLHAPAHALPPAPPAPVLHAPAHALPPAPPAPVLHAPAHALPPAPPAPVLHAPAHALPPAPPAPVLHAPAHALPPAPPAPVLHAPAHALPPAPPAPVLHAPAHALPPAPPAPVLHAPAHALPPAPPAPVLHAPAHALPPAPPAPVLHAPAHALPPAPPAPVLHAPAHALPPAPPAPVLHAPAHALPPAPPAPVLHAPAHAHAPRLALVAGNGRQLAHIYLQGVHADGVEYL